METVRITLPPMPNLTPENTNAPVCQDQGAALPQENLQVTTANMDGFAPEHKMGDSAASSRPWFKFYTRDFRDGVRVLSLEEIGAYTLVLSLIYDSGGRIKDDPKRICEQLGLDVRVWRRVRQRLIDEGKIQARGDGFLSNDRASKEITSAELIAKKRQTSGKLGGQQSGKSRAKPLETKAEAEANASTLLHTEGREQKAEVSSDIKSDDRRADALPMALPEEPKPKRSRAKPRRIATDETLPKEPTEAMVKYAGSRGFVNGSVDRLFQKWRKNHISKGTKIADADASFGTWVDNEIEWGRGPAQSSNAPPVGRVERGIYPMVYKG